MDIEEWEKRYSAKWPKRAKDIQKISEMCMDRNYNIPDGFSVKKLSTMEFDYGLAVAWKRGKSIETFVYISDRYQMFDMQRKSADDRIPRGLGTLMQQVAEVVGARLRGDDRLSVRSERRLLAHGNGDTPRELSFKEYNKSAKTKVKSKKSKR